MLGLHKSLVLTHTVPFKTPLFTRFPIFYCFTPLFSISYNLQTQEVLICKGVDSWVAKHSLIWSWAWETVIPMVERDAWEARKLMWSLLSLGDLCVDIVLSVPKLPPDSGEERKAYMDGLSNSPPRKVGFNLTSVWINHQCLFIFLNWYSGTNHTVH